MNEGQKACQKELEKNKLIPRKYHGQVFTSDDLLIKKFIQYIKEVHRPHTKIIEIGGGLGYISKALIQNFEDVEVLELDEDLFALLNKKFDQNKNTKIIHKDILKYPIPKQDYLLVGNIPFHISGRLYRRFMSEIEHKPYGMVFITDKNYAQTLAGQPPRSYRVSLQAQAYGDIEILDDVTSSSVYPEPKVMCCIMRIMQNNTKLPKNFWTVVNHHWENFPTAEVESPKKMGLERWLKLCKNQNTKR